MIEESTNNSIEVQTAKNMPDWLRSVQIWLKTRGIIDYEPGPNWTPLEPEFLKSLHKLHGATYKQEERRSISPEADLALRVITALERVFNTDAKRTGPLALACEEILDNVCSCKRLQSMLFGDNGIVTGLLESNKRLEKVRPTARIDGLYRYRVADYRKALERCADDSNKKIEEAMRAMCELEIYLGRAQDPPVALEINAQRGDARLNQFCYELSEEGVEIEQIAEIAGDIDTTKRTDDSEAWERYVDSACDRVSKRIQRYRKELTRVEDS